MKKRINGIAGNVNQCPSACLYGTAPWPDGSESHVRDSDCTLGADGCCIGCGVSHENDPCPDCGGRGLHSQGDGGWERCGWTGEKQRPATTAPMVRQ